MQCMSVAGFVRLNLESHNHFHNIFRVFDVLPSFTFTTSERMWENYLQVLQFFTSIPWGVLPSRNFVDFATNCQRSLNFSFFHLFYFLCPGILKNRFFSQFLLSFLLYRVLFSNLLSFYLSFPITLFCQLLPYVLLLFNLLSFNYSSSFIALSLILVCCLLSSCFCFL